MSENFKVLTQFVKDLSSETPDVETYLYVKDYLPNYNLNIDITSKAIKNMMIEVNTKLSFMDKGCLLYTSPSPRDRQKSRMPSSA